MLELEINGVIQIISPEKNLRSEGLAVASFDMFCNGVFSNTPEMDPYRVDAEKANKSYDSDLEGWVSSY